MNPSPQPRNELIRGVFFGLSSYLWWGFLPIYLKALSHVHVLELVGHRIVWSFVLMGLLITVTRGWGRLRIALRSTRVQLLLLGSTVVITLNWLIFIWAIYTNRLSEASLGYFLNPLISVLLGFIFFKERLRPLQKAALWLAGAGVLYLTIRLGQLPWIGLILGTSFGFYGLFRKAAPVDAMGGLAVETGIITPFAIAVMIWLEKTGGLGMIHGDTFTRIFLPLAGVMTATPLVLFAASARRLPLSVIGFMQYIAPSMQLFIAVAAFGEPFTVHHAIAFGFIWTALAFFTTDFLRRIRKVSA